MFRNGEYTFRTGECTFRTAECTFTSAEHKTKVYSDIIIVGCVI